MKGERALLLAGGGALLLMPPFLNLLIRDLWLWGLPLEVLYLFALWFALIAGAYLFARRSGG